MVLRVKLPSASATLDIYPRITIHAWRFLADLDANGIASAFIEDIKVQRRMVVIPRVICS